MTRDLPSRGEIWVAYLDPGIGHEQIGRRPVLVVSDDAFNHGASELVVALPLTSRLREIGDRVRIAPPEGGLRRESDILCSQIRTLSRQRLRERRGMVTGATLAAVVQRIAWILGIP